MPQGKRKLPHKKKRKLAPKLASEFPRTDLPSHRIITAKEAAALRNCSEDTLRRNSKRGGKPTLVQISSRRVGYWYDECVEA
jgi:hypothetical protein